MTEEQEIEFIEDEENELTTYSYISNGLYFEYFVGYELATILGYKNTRDVIIKNVSKSNQLEFRYYPGIKEPEINPKTILISRDGAIEILIKTRKRISPDVLFILKKFNIDTTNRKCLTKEQQTLSTITNVFKTEKFEDQHKIGTYYLDLYFSDYKIVIECDENGHADRKPWKERARMDYVNEKLEINDSHWIRFNPDEHDFDIAKVIGRIYRKIDEIKEEEKNKVIKELEKNNIIKNQDLDWKLQIEPTTCKFTAPPKEYLIEKLKTHNITDIAKGFGISTNPVSKWLKQYDINIKDFHNYDPPSKKELIEQCKHKTQTEVALYYNVSNHIIRKWLKDYDLDFKSVKSDIKPVTKEELLSLMSEFDQEDIPRKLNLTIVNLQKLMKTHNIEKIPTKEELEQKLHLKSKEELAVLYNTTRTTMRKWIKSYGLEHIRCKVITNKQVIVVTENNIEVKYESISELCKDLKIGKNKVNEYMDKDLSYKGYKFISVRIS